MSCILEHTQALPIQVFISLVNGNITVHTEKYDWFIFPLKINSLKSHKPVA